MTTIDGADIDRIAHAIVPAKRGPRGLARPVETVDLLARSDLDRTPRVTLTWSMADLLGPATGGRRDGPPAGLPEAAPAR